MIEFTHISIEGFCSIQELEMPLNTKGITVIRGANGFGKSTIFSALVWVLYGKNIKGSSEVNTWKKFQPKDYSGTKVEIYFKTEDNRIHRIIRCYKYTLEVEGSKGNNKLIYQIDGDEVNDRGKRNIQDVISTNLGMSYNLFLNSIMFGQGLRRLIQETGTNQREIFEEVFDLSYLSRAKKIAQDKFHESNQEYITATRELNQVVGTLDTLKESQENIQEKQQEFEQSILSEVSILKKKKASLKEERSEVKSQLADKDPEAISLQISQVEGKLKREKEKLAAAKQATGIPLEDLIDKIIKLLSNKKYDASLNELKALKNAFSVQESSKSKILELQDKSSRLSRESYDIRDKQKRVNTLTEKIKDISQQIEGKLSEKPDFESIAKENSQKISKYEAKVTELKDIQASYGESKDLYQWAYTDPLGNMGIKSYLFESCLHQLNDILATYSDTLGFYIQFEVDLKSARKDFKTKIGLDGQEVSYEELSGGQKQLVNLAMAFSMNTLIAQAQGVNIAFLDEVFESLSEDNIEIVIGLIKKVYQDKTLFLITHQDSLPIANARVLRVKRVKGLSQYEL